MASDDDLELEFEDESESNTKKSEPVKVDNDLQFSAPDDVTKTKTQSEILAKREADAKTEAMIIADLSFEVDIGVETSAGTPAQVAAPKPAAPVAAPAAVKKETPAKPAVAPVAKIADARAQQAAAAKKAAPAAIRPQATRTAAPQPRVVGSSALKESPLEEESQDVYQLREELKRVRYEADVKIAVAEYKTEVLAELLSDTKVMQLQVEQLLIRIHSKNPGMKQEVLMIKKILADFTTKKRK